MAAGLRRDHIVILRMDGQDLLEFINGPGYEAEMVPIFSRVESPEPSLRDHIVKALQMLSVDHGMPPSNDPWVMSNVVEPALESCLDEDRQDKPITEDSFLEEFKTAAARVAKSLKEQPVIVAHSESTFDGSTVKRLLSNRFELDKVLSRALETLPRDRHRKISKEFLRVVLDAVAPSAGLPTIGASERMDGIISDAFKTLISDDVKMVKEDEFKKILSDTLGSIMFHLEGNPISLPSNSVVHEPFASSLPTPFPRSQPFESS